MSQYQTLYQQFKVPEAYQLIFDKESGCILIGAGYNLSKHSRDEVMNDLMHAGFDRYTATNLSEGGFKTGIEAQEWLQNHRFLIISEKQHQDLFEKVVIPQLEEKVSLQLTELHVQYPSYITENISQLSEIQKELLCELASNDDLINYPQLTHAILHQDWEAASAQLQSLNSDTSNRILNVYFDHNSQNTLGSEEWNLNEFVANDFEEVRELKIPTNYDFTYNQEIGHQGQSLIPHFPGGKSGVTIGPGYDMGHRSPEEIYRDLTAAGIDLHTVEALIEAAHKTGQEAHEWVLNHRDLHITEEQQRYLFYGIMVPEYEGRAQEQLENFLENHPEIDPGLADWDNLSDRQRQMLFDFTYNAGLEKFPTYVKAVLEEDWAGMSNSYERYSAGELLEFRNDSFYEEFLEDNLRDHHQDFYNFNEGDSPLPS